MSSETAMSAEAEGRFATRVWLHVTALSAVAVAQPLFDLLGGDPEFFVAHHATPTDILLLSAGLVLVLPAILTLPVWLAGFAGPRMRSAVLGFVVLGLAFVLAMPLAKQVGIGTWPVAVPLSLGFGIAAAIAYQRLSAVRTFVTFLSIAILVVPGVFLARPGIRSLVGRARATSAGATVASSSVAASSTTPVLMIIFDELPLLSLLDADRQIDPVLYPNFAALARDGVWFRNATTVNDFTRWAVPSIVSGKYPRHTALPDAVDHPDTVFTLLGGTHRLEVTEAVTQLCPETLCEDRDAASRAARLAAIASDLRVVFLLRVLTDDLTAGLPDVTATWAGFERSPEAAEPDLVPADDALIDSAPDVDGDEDRAAIQAGVRQRWRAGMVASHVEPILQFIDGVGPDDPQPTFYFLHTLVSHHPYYMLPSGRKNGTWVGIPGKVGGSWAEEPWAIAQQYQRHLLQVGYIDGLVGEIVRRFKDNGIYDRALIVFAADHGMSFLPGASQRNFTGENSAEIIRVPLIFKFPNGIGARGTVSDVNAETVDIVPTIADALDLQLQMDWQADGVSLLDPSRPERATKTIFSGMTGRKRDLRPDSAAIDGPLARKIELFGDSARNAHRAPRLAPFDDLIGRPLGSLRIAEGGGAVEILHPWEYEDVDLAAQAVPFDVAGRFGSPQPDTVLAVAVNGVVEAVTRTWEENPRGWLATPRLDVWRSGANDLSVFVVENDAAGMLLRRTSVGQQRPPDLNLISQSAARDWGVRQWGFYGPETVEDGREFRWTRDVAEISNAFTHRAPSAVEIEVMMVAGGAPKNLKIEANACTLFDGVVSHGWSATFSFERCNIGGDGLTLRFRTDAPRGTGDRRRLGVAVSRVVFK